ncbi:MAG: hypothetical protein MR995_00655 [Fusobacterium mortiferum]|nr:hypothetical protein [Fusobacterium mortiferum]
MAKNHQADIKNANKGTTGTNSTYQKAMDNRSNQLNPNNVRYQGNQSKKK